MFTKGLMEYGHQTVLKSIEGIEGESWESGKVVGEWSAKDVMNHLTSMERIFLDVLTGFVEKNVPTPYLDGYLSKGPHIYCTEQVEDLRPQPITTTLQEFEEVHAQVMATLERIDPTQMNQAGSLPWYGDMYALDDYIVYSNYGHKIEHATQFELYRQTTLFGWQAMAMVGNK